MYRYLPFVAGAVMGFTVLPAIAESISEVEELVVRGEKEGGRAEPLFLPTHKPGMSADTAELLRDETGVSGARMGGRGIDPIIRGQSQSRLNVILDGAYIQNACPNRMDPPTAYSALSSYDSITVIKGSQSVIYGPGGSGGTVLFERKAPQFLPGENVIGSLSAGYLDNSETSSLDANLAVGNQSGYLRLLAEYQDADNYDDGNGEETRTAYTTQSGNVMLGWTPTEDDLVELNLETVQERDVLYAGAGMDSPSSDADTIRLRYQRDDDFGPFSRFKANAYQSQVSHQMDNYSLREQLPMAMSMRAPTESDTLGGRWLGELMFGQHVISLGMDYQLNNRDGERYSGPAGQYPQMLQSILWPDAELEQAGLFAEWLLEKEHRAWKAGLRYDRVEASIGRGDEKPAVAMSPTPNVLYSQYYASTSDQAVEDNISGFVYYQRGAGKGDLFGSLSRSVRSADATERYLASFSRMMGVDKSWVGNPNLEPEQHHQLELGYKQESVSSSLSASIFYNRVTDFILQDLARGQQGVLINNGTATIYRNVSATLYGGELEGGLKLADSWRTKAGLAYVYSENTTDNRPIAQTPPLELRWLVEYENNGWLMGSQLVVNASQSRADISQGSGQDMQDSAGWGVLNLYSRYPFNDKAALEIGINNLFDKAYAYHVNRANIDPFNPDPVLVNEPGREFWAKIHMRF